MNNYYLIALDKKPIVIKIPKDNKLLNCAEIKDIDQFTSSYTLEELKSKLLKENIISNKDIDLVIMHKNKNKNKTHINTYPIISEDKDYNVLKSVNNLGKINIKDAKDVIMTFYNKYRNADFKGFADYYYSEVNEHKIRSYRQYYAHLIDKTQLDEYKPYNEIRQFIIVMEQYKKYKNSKNHIDYLNDISHYILDHKKELLDMTNKNNITGQIKFDFDFINSQGNTEPTEEKEYMEEYYEEMNKVKNAPWDDPKMEAIFKDRWATIPANFNELLSDGDKFRAGLIDYPTYRSLTIDKENGKRK